MLDKETYELKLQVKVDKENAELELDTLKKQLEGQGYSIQEVTQKTENLTKSNKELSKTKLSLSNIISELKNNILGYVGGIFAVGAAIRKIYEETVEYIKVNRELNFLIGQSGKNHEDLKKQIERTVEALAKGTYFTKDETLRYFTELYRMTGDVEGAFKLLRIALDLSTATGKDATEVISTLRMAMLGGREASMVLSRALGINVEQGKDFNETITKLGERVKDARLAISDTEKELTQAKETINETAKTIGVNLLPAISSLIDWSKKATAEIINAISHWKMFIAAIPGLNKVFRSSISELNEYLETHKQIWKNEREELNKAEKDLDKYNKAVIKSREEKIKKEVEITKTKEKLAGEVSKIEEKIFDETMKYTNNAYEFKVKMIEKEQTDRLKIIEDAFKQGVITEQKYNELSLELTKAVEVQKLELAKEYEEKQLELKRKLRDLDLNLIENNARKEIEKIKNDYQIQANEYKKLLDGKVIDQEQYNKRIELLNRKTAENIRKTSVNMMESWGKAGEFAVGVANNLSGVFENFFQNAIKGGKNLDDALKNIFTDIANAFIAEIERMIAKWLAFEVMSGLGSAIGLGSFFKPVFGAFQSGGEVPKTGAYILHKGEKILSPDGYGSDTFKTENNNQVNININTFDIRAIDRMHIERIARQIAPYLKGKI